MNSLKHELTNGKKNLGIWGIGYIGYSSMANFAKNGVKCLGTDIVKDVVNNVNRGKIAIPNMEYWLGFDVQPLAAAGLMRATVNWHELISSNTGVHLICIPTEKGGDPYDDILIDVVKKLCVYKDLDCENPPLIIVESTITPNKVDDLVIPLFEKEGLTVGKDILLGVAPRRDWFVSPEKSLKVLPRVVGGTTPETTNLMVEVLSIVCDTLLRATDHRHAALVKSIENAYRHVEIALANQLTLAYPDINMTEVLTLVGTKWNIGTYHPSFGTGGYCIPLAPKYVLLGTKNPEYLSILKTALHSDMEMPTRVVESLKKRGITKVGVLGLAYKGDLKVDILSPTIRIVAGLKRSGISVKVHDPYYTDEEIRRIAETESFSFPEGLQEFEAVVIVADHMHYRFTPQNVVVSNIGNCRLILDNTGVWNHIPFKGIEYHEAGDKGWL